MLLKGIAAVIASSIAYGFLPIFIKTAINGGMNTETTVFFRFLFAALVSASACLITRRSFKITRKQFLYLLFYGVLGFGLTAFLLALAYGFMPVGLATMFHFCYPVFVAAIMAALFKEHLSAGKLFALCIVIAGMILMMDMNASFSLYGTVLALLSGITYAIYITAVKKSILVSLPIMINIFYVTLFSAVFFLIKAVLSGGFTLPPDFLPLGSAFVAGFLCTVVSLALLTWGIRQIGATKAAVINMIEPVTSIVAGSLVYREHLTGRTFAGCALVLLATLIISLPERVFSRQKLR